MSGMTGSMPGRSAGAIEIAGVRRVYDTDSGSSVTALSGVDLSIAAGSFVSVIGPSGCGKSTLLRVVAGLEPMDGGSVSVCGLTPEGAARGKKLGLVPQTPALLPWLSVLKNVTLPRKVNRSASRRRRADGASDGPQMEELLRKAGLHDVMHKLPAQISGGMQQRTAIVRAFGLRPDVLLMDEPFSALDEFTRESLQEQLLDLWDETKATVLFITHSVSEAVRLSDRIVVMAPRPGRITDVIDIDLPRPRGQALLKAPEFHHYEDLVRDRLRGAFQANAS
jgi:NitT/TauT family transport system ATP-binding protein